MLQVVDEDVFVVVFRLLSSCFGPLQHFIAGFVKPKVNTLNSMQQLPPKLPWSWDYKKHKLQLQWKRMIYPKLSPEWTLELEVVLTPLESILIFPDNF